MTNQKYEYNLDNLIKWLKQKDKTGVYCSMFPDSCLVAKWHTENNGFVSDSELRYEPSRIPFKLPKWLRGIALGQSAKSETFGAALRRAQTYKRKHANA